MRDDRLRVFVSSKMAELAPERAALKEVLDEFNIDAWVFEQDAGARPETIEETYKEQLRAADLYIGVFWKGYGEYTIDEFELARATDTDCLIYQKQGVKAEGRDPRLQAFLDRIGKVESGLTVQFFDTAEQLREMVKRDTARWYTRIVRKYRQGGPRPAPGAGADPDLVALRGKVRQFWVEGVLNRAVADTGLVELAKESRPEAVEAALERGHPIEPGTGVAEIFERLEGSLLILGSPGSGKTTTALELTRHLITQSERDPSRRVPVVLNLSAWSGASQSLIGWVARELSSKYQVPERFSRPWVERDRLVLVLDGLDEVAAAHRPACADAINRFAHEHGADGLLVTSRLEEYEALPTRLRINGAIRLGPLGPEQVEVYLERAGEQLAGLRAALETDAALQELARSPLMLSVMTRAYRGRRADELEASRSDSAADWSSHLFTSYVERAFLEHEAARPYSREATTSWLSWLARRMSERSRTLFLIEELQPGWLVHRSQLRRYLLGLAVVVGLVLGGLSILYRLTPSALPGGAASYRPPGAGEGLGWLVAGALFVFGIGVAERWRFGEHETETKGTLQAARRIAVNLATYSLLWVPVLVAQALLWARSRGAGWRQLWDQMAGRAPDALDLDTFVVRFMVPAAGLIMGATALSGRRSFTLGIKTKESLRLASAATARGAAWGVLAGAAFTILSYWVSGDWVALFWLPAGAAVGAVLAGFEPQLVRGKAMPNQGMLLTVRSALRAGRMAVPLAAIAPVSCLVLTAAGKPGFDEPALVAQWTISSLVFVFVSLILWFGGLELAKHYALRAAIGATRQGPWDFRRLLNYACRLKLMQRVGGGYMFLNRQLQEFFTAMDLPPPEADQVSAREREGAGSTPALVAAGAVALAGAAVAYAGLVADVVPAIVLGATLLGLGALWLVIRTAVISALRAGRREQQEPHSR